MIEFIIDAEEGNQNDNVIQSSDVDDENEPIGKQQTDEASSEASNIDSNKNTKRSSFAFFSRREKRAESTSSNTVTASLPSDSAEAPKNGAKSSSTCVIS